MNNQKSDLVQRLRDYERCHDGDIDEAADMLEFFLAVAPELLELLQEVVEDGLKTNMESWRKRADEAIAKATCGKNDEHSEI